MTEISKNPSCCNKETEFIGVTDRGENKFHCTVCFKIERLKNSYFCRDCTKEEVDEQKKVAPEGGATACLHL